MCEFCNLDDALNLLDEVFETSPMTTSNMDKMLHAMECIKHFHENPPINFGDYNPLAHDMMRFNSLIEVMSIVHKAEERTKN